MKSLLSWISTGALAVVLLVVGQPLAAHHSGAGFNSDEVKEISGTVKEFQFTNPHTWIQVIVTNDDGRQQEWSVEWGSPNSLARQGVRPSTFPAGAEVTMRINPMLNGSPAGGFVAAKLSDGTTFGRWED